jgi:hypothetical protein
MIAKLRALAGQLQQDRPVQPASGRRCLPFAVPVTRSRHMSETTYLGTETAYWVIPADDAFSVEVVTPWDGPTTVSPFATAADVKVWIAEHRGRLQSESDG